MRKRYYSQKTTTTTKNRLYRSSSDGLVCRFIVFYCTENSDRREERQHCARGLNRTERHMVNDTEANISARLSILLLFKIDWLEILGERGKLNTDPRSRLVLWPMYSFFPFFFQIYIIATKTVSHRYIFLLFSQDICHAKGKFCLQLIGRLAFVTKPRYRSVFVGNAFTSN